MNFFFSLLAPLVALVGLLGMSDLPHKLVRIPRPFVIAVFRIRKILLAVGAISTAASFVLSKLRSRNLPGFLFFNGGLFAGLCAIAFLTSSRTIFRSKQKDARFVRVDEADLYIKDEEDVLCLELNGDARAYPVKWIDQPHVVGDIVGGEDVIMTYCSKSGLGQAFKASAGSGALELSVLSRNDGNVLLYDEKSGKVIQQIYGAFEDGSGQLSTLPTRKIPWLTFKALYPNGEVFFHPPKNLLDFGVRTWMLGGNDIAGADYNPEDDEAKLYGINIDFDSVAFTKKFLRDSGKPFNTVVGATPVVVVYHRDLDLIDAFDRSSAKEVGEVQDIDPFGRTSVGVLERIPLSSGVNRDIWLNYYPDTRCDSEAISREVSMVAAD